MNQHAPMNYFETAIARVTVYDGNILAVRVRGNMKYQLSDVKEHYRRTWEVVGADVKIAALVDATEVKYSDISGEVLRYMANNEYVKLQLANALLVNNISLRRIANIYLELFHPRVPTRIFNTEDSAMEWLRKMANPGTRG
jgi:hypothetical protein